VGLKPGVPVQPLTIWCSASICKPPAPVVTESAVVKTVVDEKRVDAALNMLVKGSEDFDKVVRQFVLRASEMNGDERSALTRKIERKGVHTDRAQRAVACASRGLIDATHLYADGKVLTHQMIRDANAEALAQIAKPDHEFVFVDDDGKSRVVISAHLNCRTAGRVWDLYEGEISHKDQIKKLKKKSSVVKTDDADGLFADVKSVTPRGDGQGLYVIDAGGTEIRVILPIAKVRKMSGGQP